MPASRLLSTQSAPRCVAAFVAQSETALARLLAADLSSLDLVAIMVGGVHFGEHTCVFP